jgi:HTH-type transcriptional regulator/antitoxin HigA
VTGRRLRKAAVGFHLYGMDEVGEFDGILDEENRDVVADQVPVTFFSVKLDGKSAYVTWGIYRTCAARDG